MPPLAAISPLTIGIRPCHLTMAAAAASAYRRATSRSSTGRKRPSTRRPGFGLAFF